ncbi:MAG TPA: NAD(P)-binding domain-containing protein, partial [Bacillota bacterium]
MADAGPKPSGTVGFIGLGAMGGGMAANLVRAGYRLIVHDRVPERTAHLVELGAEPAAGPAEVARRADVVLTSLPGSAEVEAVALGPGGLIEAFGS